MLRIENLGENFLSRAHNFHPPKLEGKLWREKCSHSTYTEMPSQLQTQQSFSQPSLNSSIIRLLEYKLKNTILKLIKS